MASTTIISSAFFFLFLLLASFSEAQSDNILYSGEDLQTRESLELGIYKFIMQEDCNLVLYENNGAVWATNTGWLASNCYLSLQKDGNLVIYKPDGSPLWASNTNRGEGNYVLILQKDRNVVLYGGALWATSTNANSLSSKRGGAGAMDVVSIKNLPSPIIYINGLDLTKNVTTGVTGRITTSGRITTRAGRVA